MIGIEKQIYSETYLILVKYYDCPDTYEVWQAILDDIKQLTKNYDNYKFAVDMCLLVINQLEYKITGKTNESYCNKKAEDWNYLIQRYMERKANTQKESSKIENRNLASRLSNL